MLMLRSRRSRMILCLTKEVLDLHANVSQESGPFVEALRQLRRTAGKQNFIQIHVSLVVSMHGELKTKPTRMQICAGRLIWTD